MVLECMESGVRRCPTSEESRTMKVPAMTRRGLRVESARARTRVVLQSKLLALAAEWDRRHLRTTVSAASARSGGSECREARKAESWYPCEQGPGVSRGRFALIDGVPVGRSRFVSSTAQASCAAGSASARVPERHRVTHEFGRSPAEVRAGCGSGYGDIHGHRIEIGGSRRRRAR